MNTKAIITFIIFLSLISCNSKTEAEKKYKILYDKNNISIVIPMPKIGVVRLGETTYDGFTLQDIEKDIFNQLREDKYHGLHNLCLTILFKDKYGNYSEEEEHSLGNIDADEIKKYADYKYFMNTISNKISNVVHNRPSIVIGKQTEQIEFKDNNSSIENKHDTYQSTVGDDYLKQQIHDATYYHYHNSRFNYNISYPSFLYKNEEADNGDGCRFIMNEDIYLVVSGIHNTLNENIEDKFHEYDISSATYSRLKDNWFVISDHTPDGRIFYRKTALFNGLFVTATFYYPIKYKDEFQSIIKRIFNKFPY